MFALTINNKTIYIPSGEEAMRRYWAACQNGSPASLRKMSTDETPPDAPPPVEPGQVSDLAQARVDRHQKMLEARGIALPPPIYAAGSRVLPVGDDNFRTSRQAWEASPLTVDGLQGVYEAVQAEGREDYVVDVRDLRMRDDGRLVFGEGDVGIEANALRALVSRTSELFPRAGEYLSVIEPELRATNFNARIGAAQAGKRLRLRLRRGGSGLQVFGVVSERYASFDADDIACVLTSALQGSGMRGEVIYDPKTTNLVVNGLHHAENVIDLAAGDVFRAGVQFRSNDAAGGSVVGKAIAWRNLCLNLIIIGTGETELLRRRHIGSVADVLADVEGAAQRGRAMFEDFAAEWRVLRDTPASSVLGGDSMEDVIENLVDRPELDVGIRRDVLVEMMLRGDLAPLRRTTW